MTAPVTRPGSGGADAAAVVTAPAAVVGRPAAAGAVPILEAATRPVDDVLTGLRVERAQGLSDVEVSARRSAVGLNVVASHSARPLVVLWHQVRSPLLCLLLAAAVASYLLGQPNDAVIISVIVLLSIGLGFVNEYRAESAAEALHSQIRRQAIVVRAGHTVSVPVVDLVPGDIVLLRLGDIVPADVRLISVEGFSTGESMLTGESMPVAKRTGELPVGTGLPDLANCVLMGSVVSSGTASGVVVGTGKATPFGRIAAGLGTSQLETEFQLGLRRFSMLLVWVAGILTSSIFVINLILQRPWLEALLFSLAIAVGITPQLLPAVVATSLAAGSRQMRLRKVLVKRLVCIEDLGDVDTLFTDKTGTLTDGRVEFLRAVPTPGVDALLVERYGLLCTDQEGGQPGNPLDAALQRGVGSPDRTSAGTARIDVVPFDHERRIVSVLVRDRAGQQIVISKGAPEAILARCRSVPPDASQQLADEFAAGRRVVAVATRPAPDLTALAPEDERELELAGLLLFADPPKAGAAAAVRRLRDLDITIKIVTGDNAVVAQKVAQDLGFGQVRALSGTEIDLLDDTQLLRAISETTVFARVAPEQKARIVRLRRRAGQGVAFLGDGVNDALALHAADVGISVDSAVDVAKDAADVILLEKDLDVLADGVSEGRRIFANTMKYVLMGTSSNFGNMFSAAGASLVLSFLPMLPSQILLNNLLYDAGQLAIPTDHADAVQLRRPSHWDLGFVRKFMLFFGPLSSIFDFLTFALMLWGLHAGPVEFRTGWFVESLATQTLVVFAIRTRQVPFLRSRPSLPLTLTALATVAVAVLLPLSPLAGVLGFSPLPWSFFAALAGMTVGYLVLVELGKVVFYRYAVPRPKVDLHAEHHLRRRASQFTSGPR
jgi:Mg2+-importing ATPase